MMVMRMMMMMMMNNNYNNNNNNNIRIVLRDPFRAKKYTRLKNRVSKLDTYTIQTSTQYITYFCAAKNADV